MLALFPRGALSSAQDIQTTVGRDLSASNWLWEVLGHPVNMLATLQGGLQGWVKEGRPVEAGNLSDTGPRKIFFTDAGPKSFSGDTGAYARAVQKHGLSAPTGKPTSLSPLKDDGNKTLQEEPMAANADVVSPDPVLQEIDLEQLEVVVRLRDRRIWEVVGGADSGGIIVRQGKSTSSSQLPERLATGAIIEERSRQGERLHFNLVSGNGPSLGWVSMKLKDKELISKTAKCKDVEAAAWHKAFAKAKGAQRDKTAKGSRFSWRISLQDGMTVKMVKQEMASAASEQTSPQSLRLKPYGAADENELSDSERITTALMELELLAQ